MAHIMRIDEYYDQINTNNPSASKIFDYFADAVNGVVRNNPGDQEWIPMGDTYNDALNYLEQEGYKFVIEFSDGDNSIYEKDGVYYMISLEEDTEGGWGSWIVDLTPVKQYVERVI